MRISELKRPWKELAKLRREQDGDDLQEDSIEGAFDWEYTPEKYDFWYEVDNGNYPPIPESSLQELRDKGLLKSEPKVEKICTYNPFATKNEPNADDILTNIHAEYEKKMQQYIEAMKWGAPEEIEQRLLDRIEELKQRRREDKEQIKWIKSLINK